MKSKCWLRLEKHREDKKKAFAFCGASFVVVEGKM